MMQKRIIDTPDFKSEREEADWWFANQHVIEQMFEEDFGPPPLTFVAADIEGEDAEILRRRAAAEGLEPHVYVTRLIHNALHATKNASSATK